MKIALFSILLHLLVSVHNVAPSIYSCDKGKYHSLSKLTEQCRFTSYVPTLRSLRKGGGSVNGQQLAGMVDRYCRLTDKVNNCVVDMIYMIPCLRKQVENFQGMIAKSNWMCKPDVKEQVKAKLSTLPLTPINSRDPCYREAARKYYNCVRRFVDTSKMSAKQKAKRAVASLPCTYKALKKICPAGKAMVYTILNYDYLILPPALDVNVTTALMRI